MPARNKKIGGVTLNFKKKILAITTAVVGVAMMGALFTGCSSSKGNDKEIKVGANFEVTGGVANYGNQALKGIKLAIKQANENGGVLGKQINLIVAELETIKQKVHTDSAAKSMSTQGAAQESALEALKTSVDKFILKDKSGALSQKNFDNYIKNIKGLSAKINPDTGLLTGKKLLGSGFDPKKVMGQAEIEKAVLTLPLFGGKTRKNKKSKTHKGGRKHNKSNKH